MRRGRFLYLSDYFGADGAATGGAGIAALQSYAALREREADVSLLAGHHAPPDLVARGEATLLGGRDLREGSALGAAAAIYHPASRRLVSDALARFDPAETVVVLHQWTRWLSPSVMDLLRPYRLMVYMHDYFWACPNGAYYDFQQAQPCTRAPMGARCLMAQCDRAGRLHKAVRVARQAVRLLLEGGDPERRLMLSLSAPARRTAEKLLPGERHAVIHNPLPASASALGKARAPTRYDIGYFGRLEPEKGVGDLVAALGRTGLSGVFVGSGSLAPAVTAALGPDALVDWADHSAAMELMRACRAVVLPSRWPETWGLVTAEAMALGRPVVVSRRAGSAELVERFGGGVLFDPDTPQGLDAALERAVAEGDPPVETGAAVRDFLSSERHGRRLMGLAAERWGLDVKQSVRSPAAAEALLAAT